MEQQILSKHNRCCQNNWRLCQKHSRVCLNHGRFRSKSPYIIRRLHWRVKPQTTKQTQHTKKTRTTNKDNVFRTSRKQAARGSCPEAVRAGVAADPDHEPRLHRTADFVKIQQFVVKTRQIFANSTADQGQMRCVHENKALLADENKGGVLRTPGKQAACGICPEAVRAGAGSRP